MNLIQFSVRTSWIKTDQPQLCWCNLHFVESKNITSSLPTTAALCTAPFGTSIKSPGCKTTVLSEHRESKLSSYDCVFLCVSMRVVGKVCTRWKCVLNTAVALWLKFAFHVVGRQLAIFLWMPVFKFQLGCHDLEKIWLSCDSELPLKTYVPMLKLYWFWLEQIDV